MPPASLLRALLHVLPAALLVATSPARVAAWQRTPSPSGRPYYATVAPLEVTVPGSVFNAFVGLYNRWPAPVEGPPPGGPVPLRRRLHDDATEGTAAGVLADDDAALASAVAAMADAAASAAAAATAAAKHGLSSVSPPWGVPDTAAPYLHGAGRRLHSEPRPAGAARRSLASSASTMPAELRASLRQPLQAQHATYSLLAPQHAEGALAAGESDGRRARALQGALYGDRRIDPSSPAGRDALLLDGYLSCWLPPTRLCILQRLAAANATAGVPLSRLAPCCAQRRLIRGGASADAATLYDVPAELFQPGCRCDGGAPAAATADPPTDALSDAQVWALLQAAWFAFASQCEYLDSTQLTGSAAPGAPAAIATEFWVPEWCALARWQPHVLATYGMLEPVTVLAPTHGAFERLADAFPAFWLWLTALPACRGGFNRAEYFLRLHSAPCEFTCSRLGEYDRATATARSLVFQGCSESLTLGRVMPPGTPLENASCLVGNAAIWEFPRSRALFWQDDRFVYEHDAAARVLAEFRGTDGGHLLVLDQVLFPTGNSLAAFPRRSLAAYIRSHPALTQFRRLLEATGVMACLEVGAGAESAPAAAGTPPACEGGVPWVSHTLFAPVDAAFASLSPALLAWLFSPLNRPLARLVVLTHVLRGDTYLYTCTLAEAVGVWGPLQQVTESGAFVTVAGGVGQLALGFGSGSASPFVARTVSPWTDVETTTGLLHKVDALLISADLLAVAQATLAVV